MGVQNTGVHLWGLDDIHYLCEGHGVESRFIHIFTSICLPKALLPHFHVPRINYCQVTYASCGWIETAITRNNQRHGALKVDGVMD